MTKILIYIDFEAISMPFLKELNFKNDFPYGYTIGIYKNKKFKTKTFIFNFHNNSVENVYSILRNQITEDVRSLLSNKNFIINKNSTKFLGWSPLLEIKILENVFKGIEVKSFNNGFELSLSRLTPEFDSSYFKTLKENTNRNLNSSFIKFRQLDSDGALAALAGYLLYSKTHNNKGKWFFDINTRILVKEIAKYSQDDILRMAWLNDNRDVFNCRKDKALALIKDKQVVIKKINKFEKLEKQLQNIDHEKTIEVVLKELDEEIVKLKKEKVKLENNFDNI